MRTSSIKTEIRCIGVPTLLVGGLSFLLIALLIRLACPPPHTLYKIFGMASFMPPIWISVIAMSAFFFLGGASFFGALSYKYESVYKYKGSMFFVIMASLSFAWYPVFFSLNLFFLSLIMCIVACICAYLTASAYARLSSFLGSIMMLCALWLTYLVLLNFICTFKNI